ncbi:hypothetical protein GO988_11340 [Hymenobacter sp. HMF4947]|uniref:Uncharacterized protein n=1 Tax=Hymenobacter ginkgonis TaxID=2682976 RepID=A0A7K1TET5_9BACT|nr:hypothetical protein [Hymenobacter ginkgonis]MVN76918.1 hypothetical protein [Hymenobacter ginkgonis]
MSTIKVHVQSLADLDNKKPAITDFDVTKAQRATTLDFAILESGAVSGNTSVILVLTSLSGQTIYTECSAKEFEALAKATRDAVGIFGK